MAAGSEEGEGIMEAERQCRSGVMADVRYSLPPMKNKQVEEQPSPRHADGYDHLAIEAKWRQRWEEQQTYKADLANPSDPHFHLMMFPHPSSDGPHPAHAF